MSLVSIFHGNLYGFLRVKISMKNKSEKPEIKENLKLLSRKANVIFLNMKARD